MFWLSLHSWENIMVGSLAFAGVFAAIVGLSTWCVVVLQRSELAESKAEFSRFRLDAETKISEAKAEAAKAQLEITRLTTPRVTLLTPEANESIIAKLQPFRGTRFDIGHTPIGAREEWDFLWQLEPLFQRAGWIFVDWVGVAFFKMNWTMEVHTYGVANVSNVVIELTPEKREALLPAARALVEAFKSVGIVAHVESQPISGTSQTADAIHILVGRRE